MTATASTPDHCPTDDGWVPIAPFRAHFQRTVEQSGLSAFTVGQVCGITPATARRLAGPARRGKERIRWIDACAVYQVTAATLEGMRHERVEAARSRRRLRRMVQQAPLAWVADFGDFREQDLRHIAEGRWQQCSRLTEARILALSDLILESTSAVAQRAA